MSSDRDEILDYLGPDVEGDCSWCDGQGTIVCDCDGRGCRRCIDGERTCPNCDGSGFAPASDEPYGED